MDQHIISVAGRDFFIDQDCHWHVSVRAARRWAEAHGETHVLLSRRRSAGPGRGWGPAEVVAEIPVDDLATAAPALRRRAERWTTTAG